MWLPLDGLRAIAVILVICYHMGFHLDQGGFIGVDVFFVLSGFLITSILLRELDKHSGVGFKNFYARRALRLFPVLAVVLAACLLACLVAPHQVWARPTLSGLPFVVAYASNWALVFSSNQHALGLLGHTWSLAVEEQFYLIWPLIFVAVLARVTNRRAIAYVLLALAAIESIYRYLMLTHGVIGYRASESLDLRSDGLLVGCALAFLLATRVPRPSTVRARRLGIALAIAAFAILGGVALSVPEVAGARGALGLTAAVAATAIIIWHLITSEPSFLHRALAIPPMVWVGRRSYGLYLWHLPIIILVAGTALARIPHVSLIEFVSFFVIAGLSYRFIEQPFLRRKERFSA
jgi:peptidoglycan/LPS O-acetylase OafA/YrhL